MDKYEEALERAKNHLNDDGLTLEQYDTICTIFPELGDNENEKTRKDILAFIKREGQHIDKYKWHKWIDWLEKKGNIKTNKHIDWNNYDKNMINALITIFKVNNCGSYYKLNFDGKNKDVLYYDEIIAWLESLKDND